MLREEWTEAIRTALTAGPAFGSSASEGAASRRVLVEFVSANPNGPITAAHGRGGAVGDALASLFAWAGWTVEREFYVNDATNSRQMRQFSHSVFVQYRRLLGHADEPLPEDEYTDDYVAEIARLVLEQRGRSLENLPAAEAVTALLPLATQAMLDQQRAALAAFGVAYDNWFSEQELNERGAVSAVLDTLKASGHAYEQDGALWLRSTAFGDENDRALLRTDGSPTYLSGDLAYHRDKFERGFDLAVDVWGTDHSGYVDRTKAGLAALGYDAARLHIALYRPIRLLKDGSEVKSGKRVGNAVTLDELVEEVGRDTARFFLLLTPAEAPLDFDVDVARRRDATNPFYRVQQAQQRCSALTANFLPGSASADLASLESVPEAVALATKIADFPAEVQKAAQGFAPHRIAQYIVGLADLTHAYGNAAGAEGVEAHLTLAAAAQQTLTNALAILGISAPVL